MAQRQLSRTLPKNFTFPSLAADGADEPRTPERPSHNVDVPKAPRHSFSSCRLPRVRVRSGTDVCARMDLDLFRFQGSGSGAEDVPLPSIEVPQPSTSFEAPYPEEPVNNDDRLLAPPRQRMVFKTPEAQIHGTPLEPSSDNYPWPSWDQTPSDIPRPESACSNISDSSIESIETFASRPSVGGSCTSAESDFDSYFPLEFPKELEMSSPTLPKKQKVQRNHVKDKTWTRDMDNHLWNTYQLYLQDPTMTPFKMTPGSIPPLGVTSRVARRAKRTWEKRHRITALSTPTAADRSGSSTPKAAEKASKATSAWPKSDAKTRSRLKHLCRRKFCIAPHYQRMMQSRSPEPVADMLGNAESRVHTFAEGSCTTYATRDLGVSLGASLVASAPTPLAQLAEAPVVGQSTEWFNNPISTSPKASPHASPKTSFSQPSNQHLRPRLQPYNIPPRLGSPFVYSTWGPGGSNRQVADLPPRRETVHIPGRRFRRNTHLDLTPREGDDVFTSKEPSDEEVQRRLSDYIHDNKFQDIGHGRVRIRNRGATTSAVGPNPRDVSQLFSPPSSLNSSQAEPEETTPVMKPPVNPLLNLGGENIKRLGSPFKLEGGFKRRTTPGRFIRHAPSTSDPFSSGGIPPYAGPASNPSSTPNQEDKPSVPSLQNPFEEGLSDAERIRRQILNMPFTRN